MMAMATKGRTGEFRRWLAGEIIPCERPDEMREGGVSIFILVKGTTEVDRSLAYE